jgi:hypothetical protein
LNLNLNLTKYQSLGLGLITFGAPFAYYSYIVLNNVSFTSLGLACIILGVTLLQVPSNPIPKKDVRAMMEASCINIEAVLEEFDAKGKAIYLPPKNGRVYSFVTLDNNIKIDPLKVVEAPLRVLSKYYGSPSLIVFPPGSEAVRLASIPEDSGIEESLSFVLVDFLEAAESIKSIENEDRIIVEIIKPKVTTEFPRYKMSLGSLTTSIAGCVLSHIQRKPVYFINEENSSQKITATFEVSHG